MASSTEWMAITVIDTPRRPKQHAGAPSPAKEYHCGANRMPLLVASLPRARACAAYSMPLTSRGGSKASLSPVENSKASH